ISLLVVRLDAVARVTDGSQVLPIQRFLQVDRYGYDVIKVESFARLRRSAPITRVDRADKRVALHARPDTDPAPECRRNGLATVVLRGAHRDGIAGTQLSSLHPALWRQDPVLLRAP